MQIVYTVCGSEDEAQTIGETLVEERLAACTNSWSITSTYRWNGEVQHESEEAMIIKTRVANVQQVINKVKELHSYETPAVFVLPTGIVDEDYLQWVKQTC